MTDVDIQLFGALRDCEPAGRLRLSYDATTISALRQAVALHATQNWSVQARALIAHSAFASDTSVLRDADAVPANGQLALLPPVSGG